MNPSTLSVLLLLTGALRADRVWHVDYPEPSCVVEGSTTTIPCSFTHPELPRQSSGVGRVVRVVWCPNHQICHRDTYSVYDSAKLTAGSRFQYLGDFTSSCTLQISKTSSRDAATYRFRIETNVDKELYTGLLGVTITVKKPEHVDVAVRSSISRNVIKEGGQVTLTCTADCSFHQLDVKWYRDGQALSEKGPALHLSYLTSHNTGNYTCSLDTSSSKTSLPWSLVVKADGLNNMSPSWDVAVVIAVLLAVFFVLLAGCVIAKRRRAPKKAAEESPKQVVDSEQEMIRNDASEENSYATVHFKHNSSRSDRAQDDEVIYSDVRPLNQTQALTTVPTAVPTKMRT